MSISDSRRLPEPSDEGGLKAPPGLSFWGKVWWWFDFLILVKLARLRFIGILLVIGLVILKWDTITAYYERWTRPVDVAQTPGGDIEFFCPMHPTVVRDNNKEKCPICFMPLSKRKKGDQHDEALPPGVVNRVQLTPYRVVLAGVQTWQVSYKPLAKEIATVGSVEFNERLMRQIAARVKGRIDKLIVNETGQNVEAGNALASLYSAELANAAQNLLDSHASKNADLERTARDLLRRWDISNKQIDDILKTGKAPEHFTIRSPIKGHVIKKYVKEGQYVEEGSPLYDIVDLDSVWIQGQVFEDDMAFLPAQSHFHGKAGSQPEGLPVTASTRAYPDEVFTGKLTFVYPHVDQDTRTVQVRFELPNPEHKLRPGTTLTVKIKIPPSQMAFFAKHLAEGWENETLLQCLPTTLNPTTLLAPPSQSAGRFAMLSRDMVLAVPDSAVIDTGTLKIVYRQIVPGQFEGVKVVLGPRMLGPDDVPYYPVLGGLKEGDWIVTAGSFLIDAETRLNPAAGSIYFGGSGSKSSAGGPIVRPSTPEDPDTKIKAAIAALPSEDRLLAEAQRWCPVEENNRLGSMGVPVKVVLGGKAVFLCCKACVDKAKANERQTLDKVEWQRARAKQGGGKDEVTPSDPKKETKIKDHLAKLPTDEDRRQAESQKYCPILNKRLGSMGVPVSVTLEGERVFLCCIACEDDAKAAPRQTLKKVQEFRAKAK